ncbi:MAG: hypothetical protein EAZ24_01660 [Burkholderiales bacterium]|jgi:hypothetical protein|nr:MAG: hypothetical protein EAZ24_01660 [Burkholderiales bacterium]
MHTNRILLVESLDTMDAYIPALLALSSLYIGNEMRSRGLPKFGVACVLLCAITVGSMLLGVPKDIWRIFMGSWVLLIVVATAIMFIYYQPPADRT